MRRTLLVAALCGAAAVAVASPLRQALPQTESQPSVASPTAEAFATTLVDTINGVLSDNADMTDLGDLQGLLESAIQAVFLNSNVAPEAALGGVKQAAGTLEESGTMCKVPVGPATQRCEAVALAYVLALNAVEAAQDNETGALEDNAGAALGAPPSTGSGGGGGGVTHPPVAN